jgi:hypothetical protein
MNIDRAAIAHYTKEVAKNHLAPMIRKIQSLAPEITIIEDNQSFIFRLPNDRQFRIEMECGEKQYSWDKEIPGPSIWPYGISLLKRKKYVGLAYFLKYSRTTGSGILIANPHQIVQNLEARARQHCMPFKTTKRVHTITWRMVDAYLKSGQIIFAQYDGWQGVIDKIRST